MAFDTETLELNGFPLISFDRLRVGEAFRSDERLVRPQDVEAYAFAVDDHDPWFFAPGPFGGPIIHPTLLANQALFLRHTRYVVPAGLHARMTFEFLAPMPLGTRAHTRGRLVDKYFRRDKPYMVTEYQTLDENDRALVQGRFVQMLFHRETAPAHGGAPRPEPEESPVDTRIRLAEGRAGRLRVGDRLEPLHRTVTQRQIDTYSGVRPGSIHTDPTWAEAKGFSTTIAQGMMSTAYVSALAAATIGQGFIAGGRMDVKFLAPVFEGTTLTVQGVVVGFSDEGDRRRAHLEVTIVDEAGHTTLAGTASGLVSSG